MSFNDKNLPPLTPLIREGVAGDVTVIAGFNIELARSTESLELEPKRVEAGVAAALADPAKGRYFVAEHEGEVIGQLCLTTEWSDWRNGWFWWIQSLFIREEFRGRKIFRALFNHVRTLAAKQPDVCGLRLYVDADNDSARTRYERLGMRLSGYRLYEIDFVNPSRE